MKAFDDINAELENDWTWRFAELVRLENIYKFVEENSKIVVRKVILSLHFYIILLPLMRVIPK